MLSEQALIARARGVKENCPGCMDICGGPEIPDNDWGGANHTMPNGIKYECHADSATWECVPEFLAKASNA